MASHGGLAIDSRLAATPARAPSTLANLVRRLAVAVFVVALPVLLITSPIRVLIHDSGFYKWGLHRYDADVVTGIPMSELERAAEEIVAYFENDADILVIVVEVDGERQLLFNAEETQHMADVKDLVGVLNVVQEGALVYALAYAACVVLWARERGLASLAKLSLAGLALGLAVAAVAGGLALLGFDDAWTAFHEVLFSNDAWSLDPDTDHLIQMFPEEFWRDSVFIVAGLVALEAMALAVLAGAYAFAARRAARRVA